MYSYKFTYTLHMQMHYDNLGMPGEILNHVVGQISVRNPGLGKLHVRGKVTFPVLHVHVHNVYRNVIASPEEGQFFLPGGMNIG